MAKEGVKVHKANFRMDPDLMADMKKCCQRDEVTMSDLVTLFFESYTLGRFCYVMGNIIYVDEKYRGMGRYELEKMFRKQLGRVAEKVRAEKELEASKNRGFGE